MEKAEYIVKFRGDYSALAKDLKNIGAETKKIEDDEVIIKLAYDGNIKEFNKVFDKISKMHPELGIQFQYNVNEKILKQEMKKLDELTELKLNVDEGKVQAKLEKLAENVEFALEEGMSKDEITKRLKNVFGYYNTAVKAGAKNINFKDIKDRLDDAFSIETDEIQDIFGEVFDLNINKPIQLFKIDKSINEDIAMTQERVDDLKDSLKSLEEKGASKSGSSSEMKQLQDDIKILRSDIEDMKTQLQNLSGEAFDEMTESIKKTSEQLTGVIEKLKILSMSGVNGFEITSLKTLLSDFSEFAQKRNSKNLSDYWSELQTKIDNGDESLKKALIDLKLFNEETGKINIVGHGDVKSGGLTSNEYTLLATKEASHQTDNTINSRLQDTIVLKDKLDQAADAGVNVARILNVVYDKTSDTMFQLQETAKGVMLGGQGEAPINLEAFNASDEAIQKLISDIIYLRKIGVGVDFHGLNVFYDQISDTFSLIDTDLKPTEYGKYGENDTFENDILGGLISSFENAEGKIPEAAQKFVDRVKNILTSIDTSGIEQSAKEATQKAADALQEAQDSNSPAELTKPLGKDFTEGYAEGIREAIPEVVKACKEVVLAAYNAVKETSDAENGEGNDLLDNFINNFKESLNNVLPAIQEKIKEVFSKIDIDNKNEKTPLSSITSEDFQTQLQNTIDETGKYIIRVYGELIDDFKSRLQNSIDETGIYHVDIEGLLYDTFHSRLQDDIDGQDRYFIEVNGELIETFKDVVQEAIENLGAFPIEVKPYMRKGDEIEEVDLPSGNQNNLSSEGTTPPSQEATEQARQGLAEIREETEKISEKYKQIYELLQKICNLSDMLENPPTYLTNLKNLPGQFLSFGQKYMSGNRDLDTDQIKSNVKGAYGIYTKAQSKFKAGEYSQKEVDNAYKTFVEVVYDNISHGLHTAGNEVGTRYNLTQALPKKMQGFIDQFIDEYFSFNERNNSYHNELLNKYGKEPDETLKSYINQLAGYGKGLHEETIADDFFADETIDDGTRILNLLNETKVSSNNVKDILEQICKILEIDMPKAAQSSYDSMQEISKQSDANNLLPNTITSSNENNLSSVKEFYENFGLPSEALDRGNFETIREVLDELGGKYKEINEYADDFSEKKLNVEFLKDFISQLDLSKEKLTVIESLFEEISTLLPGGINFNNMSVGSSESEINSRLSKIRDISKSDYVISDEELQNAKQILNLVEQINKKSNETPVSTESTEAETKALLSKKEVVEQLHAELNLTKKAAEELFNSQGYTSENGRYKIEKDTIDELILSLKKKNELEESSSLSAIPLTDEESEQDILNNLLIMLENIIKKVDEKTRAFQEEGQVVEGVVQNELTNLDVLSGYLINLRDEVSKVSAEFQGMDVKINITDTGVDKVTKFVSALSKINDDKIEEKITRVFSSLDDFAIAVNNIKINDNGILSSINNLLSKSKELENLASVLKESKKKIKEATKATKEKNEPKNYVSKYNRKLDSLGSKLGDDIGNYRGKGVYAEKYLSQLKEIQGEVSKLKKLDVADEKDIQELEKIEDKIKKIKSEEDAYSGAEKQVNGLIDKVNKLRDSGKYTQTFVSELDAAEGELMSFLRQLKDGGVAFDEIDDKVTVLAKNVEDTLAKKAFADFKQAAEKSLTNLGLKIDQIVAKNSGMGSYFESEFKKLREMSDTAESVGDVQRLVAAINKLESEMINAGKTGKSFIDQIKQRLRDINSKYIAQYFSFQDILRYARQAVTNVIQLNDAFIELSKVSNTALKTLESDFQSYADIAKRIGGTITDTINATADWARMGMINAPLYGDI